MAEKIIIDVEMSSEDIRRAERQIMQARQQVERLKNANRDLDRSSEAYTKNAVEIQKLNGKIRTNQRVLVANQRAQEANKGSVEQLREQLKVVSVQWAREASAMGENSDEAKRLASQKKNLTNQLKAVEAQTGDTRRNVGNYSEGMREALLSSNSLGQGTANLFNVMKANPLLLIITLLAKFASSVGKAQGFVDAFNSVMTPFNTIIDRTIGLVQELIEGGLSKLGEILRDPLGALRSLGTELGEAAKQGQRLAALTIEIEEAQNALILTEGKLKREIEAQRFAVEDLALSNEERQEAARKAIEAIKNLEQQRLQVLNKEIEAAEIRAAQNDTDRQAQKELNELIARRDEIAADSISRQKEVRNQLNTVNKQIETEANQNAAAQAKAYEEGEKGKTEALEKEAERRSELAREEVQRNNQIYLNGLKQQLIDREITREEYDRRLYERELNLLELQRAARIIQGLDTVELDNQIADLKIANLEKVTDKEVESAETSVALQEFRLENTEQITGALFQIARQSASDDAELQQDLALLQTSISIAVGIMKAIEQGGPILGPILSGVVTAIGAVQQSRIRSESTDFADGVIGLQGPGTETSDSISANLSKGESVITAKATKVYASQLAAMEESVGNRPNFQLGQRRFARGVINAGNMPAVGSGRAAVNEAVQLERVMERMKVFVSLTELQEKKREFEQAQNFARITE